MKWFQHEANASSHNKIKKLIFRHGAEGYAVYFHCLELIAGEVSASNITFELEHDCEIIADNLKIKGDNNESAIDKVNRIVRYIIELDLFQENNNRVFCLKLANRLDNTISRNPEINKIKQKLEESTELQRSDYVEPTKTYKAEEIRLDKNRSEEIRLEENRSDQTVTDSDFEQFWESYDKRTGKDKAYKSWTKLNKHEKDKCLLVVNDYVKSTPDKQYRKHPTTYLNQKAFNDEIVWKLSKADIKSIETHNSIQNAPNLF